MVFQPQHLGLFFGSAEIEYARQQRGDDPDLQAAWQWLLAKPGDVVREQKPQRKGDDPVKIHKPALNPLEAAIANGMRYRFADDHAAGTQATQALDMLLQDKDTLLVSLMETIAAAQLYEMVRPLAGEAWRGRFAQYVDALLQAENATYIEQVWMMTLGMAAAVLLEEEALFEQSTASFRHFIDHDIHPEGFVRPTVEEVERDTFLKMTQAAAGLTLAAEAATQAGVNLWAYQNRDVSVNTAATYLVYYYFYPQKWRWQDELSEEKTAAIFRQYGAFMEIVTYRDYPRGSELLLEQQRPMFSAYVGGLTTLSHSPLFKRKRRWFR